MTKAIFTLDQFLAMASLLNEKLAEVESLRETNDMLSDQLASKAELAEEVVGLDEHNNILLDANISLVRESEELEERAKYLNDLVLHQSITISNLLGSLPCQKDDKF